MIWWDNRANLRAKNEDGALKISYRPKEYDPEDYDSEDDYFAHAADRMANWGEAMNMWALEGISWCKYMTIRIKGEEGGEPRVAERFARTPCPAHTKTGALPLRFLL